MAEAEPTTQEEIIIAKLTKRIEEQEARILAALAAGQRGWFSWFVSALGEVLAKAKAERDRLTGDE